MESIACIIPLTMSSVLRAHPSSITCETLHPAQQLLLKDTVLRNSKASHPEVKSQYSHIYIYIYYIYIYTYAQENNRHTSYETSVHHLKGKVNLEFVCTSSSTEHEDIVLEDMWEQTCQSQGSRQKCVSSFRLPVTMNMLGPSDSKAGQVGLHAL